MNLFSYKVHLSLAGFILCASYAVTGQESSPEFTDELNIEFSKKEIKRFEKAAQLLNEADFEFNNAINAYQELTELEIKERTSPNYEHAMESLFDASETYQEAYREAYSVFLSRSEDFWETMDKANHRAAGMDKAIYYERTSARHMKRAQIRHEQVLENDRFNYSLNILKNAIELDRLAVRDAGRAVQICIDYPVEYNYGWDGDKTLEEIIVLLRDPNVNEPPEDIFATLDKNIAVDSALLKEIIFKVQIAAHTEPLTEEYLTRLYKGGLKIDLIYEENWYKYSVGRYQTFDEAEATLRECDVKKAFVVAYQEGKKIGTQEAVALCEKKMELGL